MHIRRQATQSHAKCTDTPKLTTGQGTVLQRDKIQFHPSEHRYTSLQTGNLYKALAQLHLQGEDFTVNRNKNLPACRQETLSTAK